MDLSGYKKGVIGITSSFLGRYREFDVCLKNIIAPSGTYIEWALGVNIAQNFNELVRLTLKKGYEWLWILGDDHVFKPDLLVKLLERNVDMITPFCLRRAEPFDTVVHGSAKNGYRRIPKSVFDGKTGIWDATDYTIGNAGTLMKKNLLGTLTDPWFENGKTHVEAGGSDLYLCEKVREVGFKMWLDLDNHIGHTTHATAWPKRNPDGTWTHEICCPVESGYQESQGRDAWLEIFNTWRKNYDEISYEKQKEFYNAICKQFPNQNRFNWEAIKKFFGRVFPVYEITTALSNLDDVLEIGGWTGVVGGDVLDNFDKVYSWVNVEICEDAVKNTLCKNERYNARVLDNYIWDTPFDYTLYNVLFMSHSLEHMKAGNFRAILEAIKAQDYPIKFIYIDSDFKATTPEVNWTDYWGTHIFELGWDDLTKLLEEYGYTQFEQVGNARMFKR